MSNWVKVSENKEPEDDLVEAKNHGGLDDWFKKEKWVDVARPKKKVNINHVEGAIHPRVRSLFAFQLTKQKTYQIKREKIE